MPRFTFRLQTLLKLRLAERDQRREELADAYQVDQVLENQLKEIGKTLQETRQTTCADSQPGTINVDNLLNSHRHALLLGTQRQGILKQREQVQPEIERRRLALVEAERALQILEKLRENQTLEHETAEQKSEIRQMDEIALRRIQVNRKDVRP